MAERSLIHEKSMVDIQPTRGWVKLRLGELWEYRDLLYFLVWRDLKVRYKQTVLGILWVILQPLLTMAVFTVFLGYLAKVPSDGIPYPVFVFCALLPWQLFAHSLTESGNSLVANQQLIKKVYFPRLIIPICAVIVGLVDFGVAFIVLMGMMLLYGIVPSYAILVLPLFLVLAVLAALSVSLWLSALNALYRDVRHSIPFLTQFWLFATPIAYSSSLVPEQFRPLYGLNPMVGVIEGFRWAMLGKGHVGSLIFISALVVILLFWGGLMYFRQVEKNFADVV
jgi:lipopolysaccharide transport system permease protein